MLWKEQTDLDNDLKILRKEGLEEDKNYISSLAFAG